MRRSIHFIAAAAVHIGSTLVLPASAPVAAPLRAAIGQPDGTVVLVAKCRREPIWGFRMSPFCKPTGICSDRVIKGYRTVCS